MLTDKQKAQYLNRLGLQNLSDDPKALLTQLHLAHLRHLPFENLDITFGRTIELSVTAILYKLLHEQRGGFCYELNGGFYLLLLSLGFKVELLSARVYGPKGYGQEFDHLMLRVGINGQDFLADVGFGDSFLMPVPLDGSISKEGDISYKVEEQNDYLYLLRQGNDSLWQPQYQFTLTPRKLEDFAKTAIYHQTSPQSSFTQKTTCSIATMEGRITLSGRRLITTAQGEKSDLVVKSAKEYKVLLDSHFGVVLPDEFSVNSWFDEGSQRDKAKP
ncbi:arylamine N-acetyltransferase family protein [Veronia pacifica]|uniref:Acetyltransferase n=1 Tax=Veronia pacifica TaxID=1080227 RepID=A0A1C3EJ34_9GAMM|nr:arylamine N-acetyltransferase [Veronia pacifica]ODA33240.1 hypothetical protein A8L45_10555 [Veronia pacifica]